MKQIWILFLVLFFSCNSTIKDNLPLTTLEEVKKDEVIEAKIHQFKLIVFNGCLSGSYTPKLANDRSFARDYPFGIKTAQLAGDLGEMMVNRIHQDSVDWSNQICLGCKEDEELRQRLETNGMIGKRALSMCLEYYTSTELDSITTAYFYPQR